MFARTKRLPTVAFAASLLLGAALVGSAGADTAAGSVAIVSAATPTSDAPTVGDALQTQESGPKGGLWDGGAKSLAIQELVDGGFVFLPIAPYRTYDSRWNFPGRIYGGEEQYYTVLTDFDDVPMIPDTAVAVTFNITVTNTYGSGWLAVFPADVSWPGNSTVNWTQNGMTLANGGVTAIGFLTEAGQMSVLAGPVNNPNISTDYIVDITGYYE